MAFVGVATGGFDSGSGVLLRVVALDAGAVLNGGASLTG